VTCGLGLWFSSGTPVSSTNKIDCQDITEILLKVALNTITLTLKTWPDKKGCFFQCYRLQWSYKRGTTVLHIFKSLLHVPRDRSRISRVRGGGALKKIAPSGGRHANFWGISYEKS
jgi:hypothetical protein